MVPQIHEIVEQLARAAMKAEAADLRRGRARKEGPMVSLSPFRGGA